MISVAITDVSSLSALLGYVFLAGASSDTVAGVVTALGFLVAFVLSHLE